MTVINKAECAHPIRITAAKATSNAGCQEAYRYQARYIMGRGLAQQRFVDPTDSIHACYEGATLVAEVI